MDAINAQKVVYVTYYIVHYLVNPCSFLKLQTRVIIN